METSTRFERQCLRLLAMALLVAGCSGGGSSSSNDTAPPPPPPPPPPPADPQFRASGLSPFAPGCEGVTSAGIAYVNAEVEPFIAINPLDPSNIIGVYQQDRWSNGAARGVLTAVSLDGGRTWSPRQVPFSRCSGGTPANGGDYERATDPWVTFAPDGTAYQIALGLSGASQTPASRNAVLVSRSPDGGRTWSDPVAVKTDIGLPFNDKESITADPNDARFVYATWDRLEGLLGPTWFARTTNGGVTWEPARPIQDPGTNRQTINNQIVVLPDGTLVCFFTRLIDLGNNRSTATLQLIRSADRGATWSAPIDIFDVQARGVFDPQAGTPVRDAANLGAIAAGKRGELVVVWQDARFSNGARDGIAFTRSIDGGFSWSAPVRINRDPSVAAFTPAVTIRDDGTIGVTYYDFRSNTSDRLTLLTDYWLVQSSDGGATWRESRVTGPFDLTNAPQATGAYFLGDYQGLSSHGTTFVPFYAQTNSGDFANRTDILASLVTSLGAAAARKIEPPMIAEAAPPAVETAELRAALDASVRRTIASRRIGQ